MLGRERRQRTLGRRVVRHVTGMLGNDRLQLMPTRRPRSAATTRTHVLDVAHELFYWQGIKATGVDAIAKAAEVAPTTLYRLFDSKDDLVGAYVERAAAEYREWFQDALGPAEDALPRPHPASLRRP